MLREIVQFESRSANYSIEFFKSLAVRVSSGPKSSISSSSPAQHRSGSRRNASGNTPIAISSPAALDENAGSEIVLAPTRKQCATSPPALSAG